MASSLRFLSARNILLRELSKNCRLNYVKRCNIFCSNNVSFSTESSPIKSILPNSFIKNGPNSIQCRQYSSFPPHSFIKMASLSPTMETGTVISWAKSEGDEIQEGDLLAEIETDKATMAMEASESGYIAKIIVVAGTKDVPIGTVLAVIVEDSATVAAFKDYSVEDAPAADKAPATTNPVEKKAPSPPLPSTPKPQAVPSPQMAAPPSASAPVPSGSRVPISPLARTLAQQAGMDLASIAGIPGSGPGGVVRARDIQAAVSGGGMMTSSGGTQAGGVWMDVPLSNMRGVIAKRLTESKRTIPHYQLNVEINMNKVMEARTTINAQLKDSGKKLSVNDFILKAVATACRRVPEANSAWHDTFIRQYSTVDISVAVATPNGLITPIVFNAESKGLLDINEDVLRLATKAKENKLQPHEFQGGTFTVSNLGMYGIDSFSAIINPPQACILAVGRGTKKVVPDTTAPSGMSVATIMGVTLCPDHRVVDGAIGAKWLSQFKDLLENPYSMLL